MTQHDELPDEWVLTPKEEQDAIKYAMDRLKTNYQDKHLQLGDRLLDIQVKMHEINWLDEIDVQQILKTCNSNKNYDLWVKKKRQEEKAEEIRERQELVKTHTAKFIFNVMAWHSINEHGKDLIVNDKNSKLITAICFFFSNDGRFETELGYSFKKGLLVRGISGLGKTYLFDCIKKNKLNPISIYSMIEISQKVKSDGMFELNTSGMTYLDDVGTEQPTINHYGTKINFFKEFIETYYLNYSIFNKLIISTNNNFQELEDKYGFRVRSRIREMFNIINVDGVDMRC